MTGVQTCALPICLAGLWYEFHVQDLGVRYVALTSSMAMPVRYAVASMLAAAGGALLAFAAVGAALGGVAIVAHPIGATARTRVMLGVAGIITTPLAIVAAARNPFAGFAAATGDGAGLPGDLQSGVAAAHAVFLLIGTAASGVSCAETWAALSTGTLDDAWRRRTRLWNGITAAALVLGGCQAAFPPAAVTEEGLLIENLYVFVFVIAAVVFVLVEGLIIWSVIRYRRKPTDTTLPAQTHGNLVLEIIWTAIPLVTVVGLFFASSQVQIGRAHV